ncbi:MAG: prolipoprotein diacylglyceryl transferase [Nocardioides sp.]|uniref:prolipoprotein diacylglyceryl transferase n=1 Tax=Nocardioides sp. TaxID=35761 RepID=UPI0039E389FB
MTPLMTLLAIPSPSSGVWHLGPIPIRGYALCIVLGIIASIWLSERRWARRGGTSGEITDIALWAVPFGIVGARLYHVATDHDLYFGPGRSAWDILYVWHGGLGIWGAVGGGALGAWLGARSKRILFATLADTVAPTLLIAQALGRWGNWFNQELYGKPTDLPWGLTIDRAHFSDAYLASLPAGTDPPETATFHPTFLYECLWNLLAFALILWLERRFRIGYGRVMALYVMLYCAGRGWIESLRIDDVELNDVLGLRFNVWTSIVLFAAAAAYFVWSLRRHPGREESVYRDAEPVHTVVT